MCEWFCSLVQIEHNLCTIFIIAVVQLIQSFLDAIFFFVETIVGNFSSAIRCLFSEPLFLITYKMETIRVLELFLMSIVDSFITSVI